MALPRTPDPDTECPEDPAALNGPVLAKRAVKNDQRKIDGRRVGNQTVQIRLGIIPDHRYLSWFSAA